MPLIECVPNVSEGRRADVITPLARVIDGPGVRLLDQSSDPSHNRTVYTFVGEAEPVQAAVLRLISFAIALIDLRTHTGVHPRVGAVDVVPFVPLDPTTMAACVAVARSTAQLVANRHALPVFLYEEAVQHEHRRNLAEIRRGGFEGLESRMRDPAWHPDFG